MKYSLLNLRFIIVIEKSWSLLNFQWIIVRREWVYNLLSISLKYIENYFFELKFLFIRKKQHYQQIYEEEHEYACIGRSSTVVCGRLLVGYTKLS